MHRSSGIPSVRASDRAVLAAVALSREPHFEDASVRFYSAADADQKQLETADIDAV
jgi:hypothetical protein